MIISGELVTQQLSSFSTTKSKYFGPYKEYLEVWTIVTRWLLITTCSYQQSIEKNIPRCYKRLYCGGNYLYVNKLSGSTANNVNCTYCSCKQRIQHMCNVNLFSDWLLKEGRKTIFWHPLSIKQLANFLRIWWLLRCSKWNICNFHQFLQEGTCILPNKCYEQVLSNSSAKFFLSFYNITKECEYSELNNQKMHKGILQNSPLFLYES